MNGKSHQKLLNYLGVYIESNKFQARVKILRKKLGIPPKGLKLPLKTKKTIERLNSLDAVFYCPLELNDFTYLTINDVIKLIVKDFPTGNITLYSFFKFYILYNERFYSLLSTEYASQENSLCILEDIKGSLELNEKVGMGPNHTIETLRKRFENYPIIIKIHPATSIRDLIDYIKTNGKLIESYLVKYKDENSKVGKIRKGNPKIKERNQFIYKNRHLPYKNIITLVRQKFPDVWETAADVGAIGKIISLQDKIRKEV